MSLPDPQFLLRYQTWGIGGIYITVMPLSRASVLYQEINPAVHAGASVCFQVPRNWPACFSPVSPVSPSVHSIWNIKGEVVGQEPAGRGGCAVSWSCVLGSGIFLSRPLRERFQLNLATLRPNNQLPLFKQILRVPSMGWRSKEKPPGLKSAEGSEPSTQPWGVGGLLGRLLHFQMRDKLRHLGPTGLHPWATPGA